MLNFDSIAKELFKEGYKQRIEITFPNNNKTIKLTDNDIVQNTFKWDRYCATGDMMEIGSAVSSEIEFTLRNTNGYFFDTGGERVPVEDITFEGKELTVRIGVKKWDARRWENAQEYWYDIGKYTIMTMPHKFSTIPISALDRMTWFDMYVPAYGENPFNKQERINTLVGKMCSALNIQFYLPTTLPNRNLIVDTEKMLEENQQATYRQIVQWVAQITGTCAYIDTSGILQFRWVGSTDVRITSHDRFPPSLVYEPVQFTGLTVSKGDNSIDVGSDTLYRYFIADNGLIQGDDWQTTYAEAINNIWDKLEYSSPPYRPFEASTVAMPYLEPLDIIEYEDNDGTVFSSPITHITFTLNGTTEIKAVGQSETEAKCVTPTGRTAQETADYTDLKNRIAVLENATVAARERLTSMVQMALGLHLIEDADDQGGVNYYFTTAAVPDENPTLADVGAVIKDSDVIYLFSGAGWVWCSGANWDAESQAPIGGWTYGITKDGTAVLGLINTSGININDEGTEYKTAITPETFSTFKGTNLVFGFNAALESQINKLLIKSNFNDPSTPVEENAYIRLGNAKLIPADDGLDIVYVEKD